MGRTGGKPHINKKNQRQAELRQRQEVNREKRGGLSRSQLREVQQGKKKGW